MNAFKRFEISRVLWLVLICVASVVLPGRAFPAARADDWPQWRYGPGRGAVCPGTLSDSMQLAWRRRLPAPRSAWPESQPWLRFDRSYNPVCGGGLLLVPSMVNDSVTAYEATSGRLAWRFFADGPVRLAPAIDLERGAAYFGSDDGCVYCVGLKDGSLRWRRRLAPRARRVLGNGRLISTWPVRTGVVLYRDDLYATAGIWPMMGIFACALDPATGAPRWINSGEGATYQIQPHNSPAFSGFVPRGHLAASAGGLIAPGGRTPPACYDLDSGHLRWFNWLHKGGATSEVSATDHWMFSCGVAASLADGKPVMPVSAPLHDEQNVYSIEDGRLVARSLMADEEVVETVDRKGRKETTKRRDMRDLWSAPLPEGPHRLLLKTKDRFYLAVPGAVAAVDVDAASDAEEPSARITWETTFEGEAWTALAADKRLFLVTVQGEIYCFGDEGQPPQEYDETGGNLPEADSSETVASSAEGGFDWDSLAQQILTIPGTNEGYALVLGLRGGRLAEALARNSQLHVVAVDADATKVDAFRRAVDARGWYGTQTAALACAPIEAELPPYVASLIVSEDPKLWDDKSAATLLRITLERLRPYGGVAVLPVSMEKLATLVDGSDRLAEWKPRAAGPNWTVLVRSGPLPGAADWTHQYADAANSVVSADDRVRLPLGLLWFGGPSNDDVLPRHGHGPSPQVAGGRLVIEGRHMLRSLDIYTGRLLWERELPDLGAFYDFTDHRPGAGMIGSNYVTLPDSVYAVFDRKILRLDAASGKTLSRFSLPPETEGAEPPHFGYLAVSGDLLVATADPVTLGPEGFDANQRFAPASRRLVVMDRFTGEVLWTRQAKYNFRHNNIAVGAEKVFCIDGLSEPKRERWARLGRNASEAPGAEQEEATMGRNATNEPTPAGSELPAHSSSASDSEAPGDAPSYRAHLLSLDLRTGDEIWSTDEDVFGTFLNYSAEHDILLQAGSAARDRAPDETRSGMAAYRGKSGEVIWKNLDLVYSGPCMLHHGTIITQGPAYDLHTGEPRQRKHPLTDRPTAWQFTRNYGCNTAIGSEHLLTFRSAAAGYYDLDADGGTGNFGGFKSGCTSNLIPAGGLLNAPEYTRTCTCNYQNQTSLALVHDEEVEVWTFNALEWEGQPVRRVGVNFGAPGDRRDASGTLWLDWPSRGGPSPDLPLSVEPLEGAAEVRFFRHHSLMIRRDEELQAAPHVRRWVAASGLIGECRILVPLSRAADREPQQYTVRLHFVEPEQRSPGERVFDVSLQGNPVVENLDVADRVGTMRPCVVVLKNIEADETLEIRLKAKTAEVPPVLCGIELVAESEPAARSKSISR